MGHWLNEFVGNGIGLFALLIIAFLGGMGIFQGYLFLTRSKQENE